jgi:N-acetylmuramoyl-L-alanine amidase
MSAQRHLQHVVAASSLLLTGVLSAQAPNGISITAVRFWTLTDVTRVAIETTGDFEFRSDRVDNPERLFFDVIGAKSRLSKKGQQTIPVSDRLLKQIRVAETQPGTTRVVFDLEAGVDFSASQLSNPSRLIIELRPSGAKPPLSPLTKSVTGVHRVGDADSEPLANTSPVPTLSAPPVLSKSATADAAIQPITNPVITDAASVAPPLPKQSVRPATAVEASRGVERAAATMTATAPPLTKKPIQVDKLPEPTHARERASIGTLAPKPATLPKNGGQSLTRVLGLKVGRIVLDAGHGGHDAGTNGPNGLLEKDLVLDVTKRLGALIESRLGSEVVYTRSDDTFVPLEVRTEIANEQKADLFLSIHANSSPVRSSSGVETYYLNFTTSKSALEVATRENASSQKTVYELKDLLQKIALKDKVEESREFATRVQTALFSLSAKNNAKAKDRGIKKAPFVVLIGAQMPSVLAEIGFVSNPKDEGLMKRGDYRQKIAEALFKGLSQYASTLSHFQVAKN